MCRIVCLWFLLGQLIFASCSVAGTGSWEPVDGPYDREAARSLYEWIDNNIQHSQTLSPSDNNRDVSLLKKLVKGTLIWAYSYGSIFDGHDFLLHFSAKDESVEMLPLHDGGLLFMLENGCLKISRDRSSPEDRIFPEENKPLHLRSRWYATVFNNLSEVTFYFSAVGPFPPEP